MHEASFITRALALCRDQYQQQILQKQLQQIQTGNQREQSPVHIDETYRDSEHRAVLHWLLGTSYISSDTTNNNSVACAEDVSTNAPQLPTNAEAATPTATGHDATRSGVPSSVAATDAPSLVATSSAGIVATSAEDGTQAALWRQNQSATQGDSDTDTAHPAAGVVVEGTETYSSSLLKLIRTGTITTGCMPAAFTVKTERTSASNVTLGLPPAAPRLNSSTPTPKKTSYTNPSNTGHNVFITTVDAASHNSTNVLAANRRGFSNVSLHCPRASSQPGPWLRNDPTVFTQTDGHSNMNSDSDSDSGRDSSSNSDSTYDSSSGSDKSSNSGSDNTDDSDSSDSESDSDRDISSDSTTSTESDSASSSSSTSDCGSGSDNDTLACDSASDCSDDNDSGSRSRSKTLTFDDERSLRPEFIGSAYESSVINGGQLKKRRLANMSNIADNNHSAVYVNGQSNLTAIANAKNSVMKSADVVVTKYVRLPHFRSRERTQNKKIYSTMNGGIYISSTSVAGAPVRCEPADNESYRVMNAARLAGSRQPHQTKTSDMSEVAHPRSTNNLKRYVTSMPLSLPSLMQKQLLQAQSQQPKQRSVQSAQAQVHVRTGARDVTKHEPQTDLGASVHSHSQLLRLTPLQLAIQNHSLFAQEYGVAGGADESEVLSQGPPPLEPLSPVVAAQITWTK